MVENVKSPVGYGQPPLSHRIKQGEVRNPWGRKGKPKPQVDFLEEPFELKMKEGGSIKTTRGGAIDHYLFGAISRGNVSASKELDRRIRQRAQAAKDEASPALTFEDEEALKRFAERYLRDHASMAEPSSETATRDLDREDKK